MSSGSRERRIMIISDGTGETAAQMTKAAMVQFATHSIIFSRYKNIRTKDQIKAIVESASNSRDMIVFTMVSPTLRNFMIEIARTSNVFAIDLLGPLLAGLASFFGYEPMSVAGLLHDINEHYFERIEAMEYTIQHDDGRDFTKLDKADLIIIGISRTSKTPLSMYLSHKGWKVVNIPLIKGFGIPKEVYDTDQKKVIGLTIDPADLVTIRRARLQRLGQAEGGEYADAEKVNEEIEYANEIFKKNRKWPIFNVTGKALEETASEILKLMTSRGLAPPGTLGNPRFPIIKDKNEATPEPQQDTGTWKNENTVIPMPKRPSSAKKKAKKNRKKAVKKLAKTGAKKINKKAKKKAKKKR